MIPKIAVIWFPGNNCEEETKIALESAGMDATIIRWNSKESLDAYHGFVIPGGWSYEDRIRAGVISSKDPALAKVRDQAKKGKPILGICNGCQVLVESGMVPGSIDKPQMATAPNKNPFVPGFYCTWVKIKNSSKKKNAFNLLLEDDEVIDIPIAHGEGRFATKDASLIENMQKNSQIAFQYCDDAGNIDPGFPINPNGSVANIAGITNEEGNVLAMMPHPERAFFRKQQKEKEMHNFEDAMALAAAARIFESMREYILGRSR